AFNATGTGAVTGGGTGTDAALGAGVNRTLTVSTTTAGAKNGMVNVSSTSEAVANGMFSQSVSVNVLDHANASFSSLTDTNTLTLDFGTLAPGASLTQNFALANLLATNGFTAGLDLDAINATGNTGAFSTTLMSFTNAAAGGSQTFGAMFSALAPGDYAATYTLLFSDQNLPGATSVGSLQLNVVGRVAAVVPEAGTLSLLALALPVGAWLTARRRRG
ncbi:MAG: hypothetical protein H7Y38_18145, partial [Armatimonadetes bacterium]|nr:hypothetical protein [Armatimonadota bacterium]